MVSLPEQISPARGMRESVGRRQVPFTFMVYARDKNVLDKMPDSTSGLASVNAGEVHLLEKQIAAQLWAKQLRTKVLKKLDEIWQSG